MIDGVTGTYPRRIREASRKSLVASPSSSSPSTVSEVMSITSEGRVGLLEMWCSSW